MSEIEVRVPDIGDFKDVPVIEVLVKNGDRVKKNDSLVTLESEKASMEVPAEAEGVVQDVKVKVGDKVSQGSPLLVLSTGSAAAAQPAASPTPSATAPAAAPAAATGATVDVRVPDIGDFKDVPVIEVLVKTGDRVKKNDSLITLESEKASMEVPAETDGVVQEVKVKVGDRVSQGATILVIGTAEATTPAAAVARAQPAAAEPPAAKPAPPATSPSASVSAPAVTSGSPVHASPGIRRFARELGVELSALRGSGPNGRVTREDVQEFVKQSLRPAGRRHARPLR